MQKENLQLESNSIFINSQSIIELKNNKDLTFQKKSQKIASNTNYYISPNLKIKLFNPQVIFIDRKYLVLSFNKEKYASLLNLLKTTNNNIYSALEEKFVLDKNKTAYSIVSESESYFTLRCSLPHFKNKYFIKCKFEDEQDVPFTFPKKNIFLKCIYVDIRSIWETSEKRGFNLEIKFIDY
jgi:hypothetical protein